jgi:two-component system response regulator PilR (NtrC family)
MANETKLALIVDDEPDLLSLLAISLGRMGVDVIKAGTIKAAKEKLTEHSFTFCLTDLRLPDGSGLEIVDHVNATSPSTPIAVITAFGEPETAVKALKSGAFDYVCKPIEVEDLESLVNHAIGVGITSEKTNTTDAAITENNSYKLIGKSEPIQTIRTMIDKVSRNQAPVHISGETGTGKELIARMIHQQSPRASAPFIAVNCGAIPKELMESEFFGHKKGSFTGAHTDTEGLFQAANGGTLFLDEVGDLPLELQVKLLRVIQEKRVRSVGDTIEKSIDIRLISATHRNLSDMIQSGDFREDFFYRINVIPIHAPPVRSRKEDIEVLVINLVNRIANEHNIEPPRFTEGAISFLQSYAFPGNVREMENILERTIALHEGGPIDEESIILPTQPTNHSVTDHSGLSIDNHIVQVEIDRIQAALEENQGNITAAAKSLGTTFRSLRYRIKKLEIKH